MASYRVPVQRTAIQLKYITVEAGSIEEAYDKALEDAPSEDWTGDTHSSSYDIDDTLNVEVSEN